jgi:arsenite oxidase small subunit
MGATVNGPGCISRRQALILGGVAGLLAGLDIPQALAQQGARLVGSRYRAKSLMRVAELRPDTPVEFTYPDDSVTNVLVRLGEPAGGGIGPGRDIVAFNTVCPHMGGPVGADTYKPRHKVLGPCPLHLTTFDLTRFGMVVSGHATQSLPQVQLEIRQGRIFAVGMMGLVYGHASNPRG